MVGQLPWTRGGLDYPSYRSNIARCSAAVCSLIKSTIRSDVLPTLVKRDEPLEASGGASPGHLHPYVGKPASCGARSGGRAAPTVQASRLFFQIDTIEMRAVCSTKRQITYGTLRELTPGALPVFLRALSPPYRESRAPRPASHFDRHRASLRRFRPREWRNLTWVHYRGNV